MTPTQSFAPGTRALRRTSFDGRIGTNMGATPKERSNERAWENHFRPAGKTPDHFDFLRGAYFVSRTGRRRRSGPPGLF
jgi:hypothetical protein